MKFNLYYSDLNQLSSDKLILSLKDRDKSQKHIIITPDKSSLYYERKLFALLNEQSFFDVTTTTLSRFANSVIGKGNNILSKQGGVLIIKRILNECKSQLKSFAKSSDLIGFAGSLFNTICMFKSCHIEPGQIEMVTNETLNNKLQDIKLVYEKYEEYLKNEYTDSFNRLNLCAQKISKETFKDTNFYFVGFDDFTKQGYLIIEKLIKCSSSVSVATTLSKKGTKNNSNIYLNNVYYNCLDIANIVGVECNRVEVKNILHNDKIYLSEQILANKVSVVDKPLDYIDVVKYDTLEDEIKNTVLDIKYNIINNKLRYGNFAIVVSDLSKYKNKLKENLDKVGVKYFIDESLKLKDTMLARFVSNLISMLYKPTKFNIVSFLKNPLIVANDRIIDNYMAHIDKYEPQFDNLFKYNNEELLNYFNIILKYRKSGSEKIDDLLAHVRDLLNDLKFTENVERLMKEFYSNNDLENYRLLKQSHEKIIKIFDEISVISEYECDYQELNKFFDLFTENISIVVPPIIADSVFITSIECENLFDIDYVYFLGFNEGFAPKYNIDSGIISDDEINKMPLKSRLNPTINVINKRLKFKLFELLFVANKKIVISYPLKSSDGDMYPNAIINSVISICGPDKIKNGSNNLDLINNSIVNFDEENFTYNNYSLGIALDNYVEMLKYWDNYCDNKHYVKTMSLLHSLIGDKTYIDNVNYNNNIKPLTDGLFLNNGKVGISQIERFNTCPYMHFIDYGLRLKSCEKNDMSAVDLGNIIHEFLKNVIFRLDEEDISKTILDKILNKEEYKYLIENKKNNFMIKALYDEVERIFKVLKYQQSLSSFKTLKSEMPFNMKVCKIDNKDIYLTGVIDRVDGFDNGIRIIDYKTGLVEFKNYDDIYHGNKIQVVVYLSALSQKEKLKPLGALYLPISNSFAEEKSEDLYQMQGIINKGIENILAFDKNLSQISYSSNIINLSTTTKGEISSNNYYKNMCLDDENIAKLSNFVMDLVKSTIKNIDSNIINPNPIDEHTCEYCEYKGLCNFSLKYGNLYKEDTKIRTIDDLIGGE